MKREHSETDDNDQKRPKKAIELNLAGYDIEDKRVAKAINFYETKLLPFVENSNVFRSSNFLSIKGYGFIKPNERAG